ncbi:type IV pilus assembly protein PilM [Clostridium bornimense]|uniref:Type IV pilus assembly protein PilM n=1 Tax=Clostridium bornimense TaxID=1216932 RepID=W6RVR6_9CLOT|nr:pilus assembly protein PilM [Clostridium bornimense]CDM67704.1 type IV pilus assembly protein PilM [Clostridium bornimense]
MEAIKDKLHIGNEKVKNININKFKSLGKSNRKKDKEVIVFDIGTSSIKVLIGRFYRNKVVVRDCIIEKTPEGSVIDGAIINILALESVVKKIIEENDINIKDVICTTNSSSIINREIYIPKVDKSEMDTVIKFEIQEYLPINLNNYIVQYIELGEEEVDGKEKIKVNVIAYPEKVARTYYEFIKNLGFKPYALDATFNSLNKIVKVSKEINEYEYNDGDTLAFIDMGAASVNVNIYKDEKLDFTRILKLGGNEIDEALKNKCNIPQNAFERVKFQEVNLIDLEEEGPSAVVRDIIEKWTSEIDRIFKFYKSKDIGNKIDRIFIYGGISKTKGIESYLSGRFTTKVRRIKELSNVYFEDNRDGEASIEKYVNAIGALIRLDEEEA